MHFEDSGSKLDDDDFTERLVSRRPIIVRRRVLWGECDPAQVVYTPRFSDYLGSAYAWFIRVELAKARPTLEAGGLTAPAKAMALEFKRVLRPHDLFDMKIHVTDIRRRTFDIVIDARSPQGEAHFSGRLSPILVRASTMESVEIPVSVRGILESYRDAYPLPVAE